MSTPSHPRTESRGVRYGSARASSGGVNLGGTFMRFGFSLSASAANYSYRSFSAGSRRNGYVTVPSSATKGAT